MAEKTRLDVLREFAAKDPRNPFPRYGIAMELIQLGREAEAAEAFAALVAEHPKYVPTYFQAGKVLEKLGRLEDARAMYRSGIDAASAAGNRHAAEEIEAALSAIE